MLLVDLCNWYYDDIDGFLFQVIDKVQEETKNRTGIVRSFFLYGSLHLGWCWAYFVSFNWIAACDHRKLGLEEKVIDSLTLLYYWSVFTYIITRTLFVWVLTSNWLNPLVECCSVSPLLLTLLFQVLLERVVYMACQSKLIVYTWIHYLSLFACAWEQWKISNLCGWLYATAFGLLILSF